MATKRSKPEAPICDDDDSSPVLTVPSSLEHPVSEEVSGPDAGPAGLEERLLKLEQMLLSSSWKRTKRPIPESEDSEWEDYYGEDSSRDYSSTEWAPVKKKAKKVVSSSDGEEYTRARKKVVKRKKSNKRKKKDSSSDSSSESSSTESDSSSDSSSTESDSSSDSSSTGSDSDTQHAGKYAKIGRKVRKKYQVEKAKKVLTTTMMREMIKGHFNTFKPTEVITKLAEKHTGIKGIPNSVIKEMDKDVRLNDKRKKFEGVLHTVHKAVLGALTAIAPIANRMQAENKFSSLCGQMDDGIAMLTAASNFLSYRRFENVFKAVCTDAGKEVARSKKVVDNDGKEYTLFLPPKPIKGKPLDKTKMFGGQLQYLFKQ